MPFYDPGYLGIERTDEIVFVQVFLSAGRSTERKKAFYARVASLLTRREWHLAMKRCVSRKHPRRLVVRVCSLNTWNFRQSTAKA
jgi:hypothetical protein